VIIFMGVAGSGKSVQGRLLADTLGLPWLSTGEFLRMLISGQRRKDMQAGKLLEDTEIIGLIRKIFGVVDTTKEFVLDGFPRTIAQADWLLSQVKHGQLQMTAVIHMVASKDHVKERLLTRGRQDDTEESINERFREFEEEISQILDHCRQAGCQIYDINAEQPIAVVHEEIMKVLEPLVKESVES
jgi:adenylate kinase